MRPRAAQVLGLVPFFACWAAPARADSAGPEEQPLRIQYAAHEGCPDALGFFWHVRARTRRVRLAEEGELAIVTSVRIDRDAGESVGTLEIPGPGPESQPFVRRVRAQSCEEVVLALSLVLALAYDPDAVLVFPPVPQAPPPSKPPPVRPILASVPSPPSPAPERHPWRAAFALDGLFMNGVVTNALSPGFGAVLEFGRSGGPLAPTLGASFVFLPKRTIGADTGPSATFGYAGARISLCPLGFDVSERLTVAPCLGADIGGLSASSRYPTPLDADPPPVLWGQASLFARLRWNFFDRFFGETTAGAGVSFYRAPFSVYGRRGEEIPVFQPSTVVADFGVGLGAYFP